MTPSDLRRARHFVFAHLRPAVVVCLWLLVGSVPVGAQQTSWLLAEGATGFFEEEILIGNPNASAAEIKITYFVPGGATPQTDEFTMPATSRRTVRVNAKIPASAVSALVECTNGLDIVVERSMYWPGAARTGAHTSRALAGTATEWYLAEGATGFFDVFILLVNIDPVAPATVTLTFQPEFGDPETKVVSVGANSRQTIWVNQDPDLQELASRAFSTKVTSSIPIAVERAMYFPAQPAQGFWRGGHGNIGQTAPSTTWLFGEGFTGPGPGFPFQFDTFLLLNNPSGTGSPDAHVGVDFFTDTSQTFHRDYTVGPGRRLSVWVDMIEDQPELANAAFSMRVTSDEPIIAERAMYFGTGTWEDAHNVAGATAASDAWAFAEGVEDGIDDSGTFFDSFFLVLNPSTTTDLQLRGTFVREDGTGIVETFTVPKASRKTIWTASFPELSNQRFASFFETTNGVAFVAERAVYWSNFAGGHASLGVPWTGPIATPPAPPAPTVAAVAPGSGSTLGGTPITVTGTGFAQGATVTVGGTPASGVFVLNSTTLMAIAPAHAPGQVAVEVTSAGQNGSLANAYTYIMPPSITGVAPDEGTPSGGTDVTITGSGFAPGSTVRFGGSVAANVVVVNANQITARTPAHGPGLVNVEVTLPGGISGSLGGAYLYKSPFPTTQTPDVMAFGDSITAGVTSSMSSLGTISLPAAFFTTGYPERLRSLLQQRYSMQAITVRNEGEPGECVSAACKNAFTGTFSRGRVRFPGELTGDLELVIIMEGTNDASAGFAVSAVASGLSSMVQDAKAAGKQVIISTLIPKAPWHGGASNTNPRIAAYNDRIAEIAAQEGVVLVDMWGAFGGASNMDTSLMSPDGTHPNSAGYQRMAQVFFGAIVANFEVGGS